jgi:glucose-1-phosphate thymidylyltransferase
MKGWSELRGIVLAGGAGTRLSPLTKIASKQLLPVFDKPLIHYPISTLMLAGIREILIIVAPREIEKFQNLLGNGSEFGIRFEYVVQERPEGLAQSLILAEDFLDHEKCCLILGDNIFHGPRLGRSLAEHLEIEGAHIFGFPVKNPSAYGVASVDDRGSVQALEEKPQLPKSNLAIPGLYFFDSQATAYAKEVKSSPRGELEIIDVLEAYRLEGKLKLEKLPLGTAWFDTGTFTDLHDAATYVRLMEERTGIRVGDPKDVAKIKGWIQ